jgi:hypothetical protein
MAFEPTTCSDCSYPPNFTVLEMKSKNGGCYFAVKCRDCGDSWEETDDSNFSEIFFETPEENKDEE